MNESECASLLASVQWTDPTNLVSLAVLAFINVLVIVGNCLVIAAVLCSHKLRSVTNFFIVSLAVADLLVGLAVLPFSATWEVFKVGLRAAFVWFCFAFSRSLHSTTTAGAGFRGCFPPLREKKGDWVARGWIVLSDRRAGPTRWRVRWVACFSPFIFLPFLPLKQRQQNRHAPYTHSPCRVRFAPFPALSYRSASTDRHTRARARTRARSIGSRGRRFSMQI